MYSAYTEKSISSRDNLLDQDKLRVSRRIFICSSVKLCPIRPDPGQLLRASSDSTVFFVLKTQENSLLLGLLQKKACPFFPKTSLKGETLSHSRILLKTSLGRHHLSLIPFDLCSLLRTETETELVLDFRHSCVIDLSLKI